MALQKTLTTVHGFLADGAYHRVEGISFFSKEQMVFRIRSYKEPGLPHFADDQITCAYNIQGGNPWEQAYEHLKTLPEFKGAEDC
jgi:hypothetical protein